MSSRLGAPAVGGGEVLRKRTSRLAPEPRYEHESLRNTGRDDFLSATQKQVMVLVLVALAIALGLFRLLGH